MTQKLTQIPKKGRFFEKKRKNRKIPRFFPYEFLRFFAFRVPTGGKKHKKTRFLTQKWGFLREKSGLFSV